MYTRIHGRPPAETELRHYFRVKPPASHQIIVTLDRNALISLKQGTPRSIEVLVPPQDLPLLEFLLGASGTDNPFGS